MSVHQKAKQRVHTHRGVDFICVPGSTRERVLLDLFQAEDRLSMQSVRMPDVADIKGGTWFVPMVVGALSGFVVGFSVGWLV